MTARCSSASLALFLATAASLAFLSALILAVLTALFMEAHAILAAQRSTRAIFLSMTRLLLPFELALGLSMSKKEKLGLVQGGQRNEEGGRVGEGRHWTWAREEHLIQERVETKDAGRAEATVDATKLYAVKHPTVFGTAIVAFGFGVIGGGGSGGGTGLWWWKVHVGSGEILATLERRGGEEGRGKEAIFV
ncbi:hypothetical protein O6P43_010984 [Quillaja saponaria]|uniref:Uncharacterized protein n=1 Tax=Quillaja saponaria TaxID=32244 RepID=A0AAD7VF07_QUISA|nr:hypothetical protein O6P43_010984 [Quillaja saponaria]